MTIEERLKLIQEVGEETVEIDELKKLLSSGEDLIAYDGFEPSGQMHIAQGILRTININKMIKAGIKFKMLVADWHAWANNKMDGDLDKIQTVGKYFIEVWKACGMDLDNVEFVWASDLVKKEGYWKTVLQIARENTIKRIIRCAQIMGREENTNLSAAQIIYPCMQAADIFHLGTKITQLGMDQRKVNMLAREVGPKIGYWKPIVISHHMLMGLQKPVSEEKDSLERTIELKMSKSKPDTAIFMTDTTADVKRKILKAWCPEGEIKENPIFEYCRYILFETFPSIVVKRRKEHGGNVEFNSYKELEAAFEEKGLHPEDLKKAVVEYLNLLLQPVRDHFEQNAEAKELLNKIQDFKVTR